MGAAMTADEFNELADGSWKYEIERLTTELDKARTTIARMNSMESEHCADLAKELAECRKDAEENATLRSAISLYEAALKEAFPRGAKGRTFDMWNSARIIREAKP